MHTFTRVAVFVCSAILLSLFVKTTTAAAFPTALQTGQPGSGITATVLIDDNPDINVRSGPGVDYELVGKLLPGQQVPALGRSVGGDWVQIEFAGGPEGKAWVYSYLVSLSGSVPVVEPPATPTPRVTPTIDPTLAAQFIIEIPATRLPTFTPPPPLAIPTYTEMEQAENVNRSALVYAMLGLSLIGLLGIMLSFVRVR